MEEDGKYFENRPIGKFSKVIVKTVGCYKVHQAPVEQLIIHGNKDVLSRIRTQIRDDVLMITYNSDWLDVLGISLINPEAIHFSISTPVLDEIVLHSISYLTMQGLTAERLTLSLDGPGSIKLSDVQLSHLQANLTGVGAIEISGKAQSQIVNLSGAGTYKSANLESQNAQIHLSGVGSARVSVQKQLDVSLSGAGSVEYFGAPAITQKITGLGMLKSIDRVSI
jgi:hypothetical protein